MAPNPVLYPHLVSHSYTDASHVHAGLFMHAHLCIFEVTGAQNIRCEQRGQEQNECSSPRHGSSISSYS